LVVNNGSIRIDHIRKHVRLEVFPYSAGGRMARSPVRFCLGVRVVRDVSAAMKSM
jgi:hypothetical protein